MRRYPIEPLMVAVGITTREGLRLLIPMNGQQYRLVFDEGLSELQADRWAVRLGLHPSEVWPAFGMVECAADDCDVMFAPVRASHRYCSKRCRERIRMRIAYQTRPEVRAARIAGSARYYAEAGDYVRARMRRRHQNNRPAELERMSARYHARRSEEKAA